MKFENNSFDISWSAPVIPSVGLAGIVIGSCHLQFAQILSKYRISEAEDLYQFVGSPILRLECVETPMEITYLFSVADKNLTNWNLYAGSPDHAAVDARALAVLIRDSRVHAVKAWLFEYAKPNDKRTHVYAGKLPQGIGLGDRVADLLPYTALIYDDAEEWFYADESFGGLEITGYGEMEDYPDQPIVALAVIAGV